MRYHMRSLSVLFVLSALPCWAQPKAAGTTTATAPPALAATTTSSTGMVPLPTLVAEHVIAPRDTLHLIAWTPNDVVVNSVVTVGPDGTVTLPVAETLRVDGLKIRDLQTNLAPLFVQRFPGSVLYVMLAGQTPVDRAVLPPSLTVDEKTQGLVPNVDLLMAPLAPADQLYVRVWSGETVHLEVTVKVSEGLTISLPPLGAVSLQGYNLLSLRDYLLQRYRYYYPRCAVNLLLTGHAGQPITGPTTAPPTPPETPAWQKLPPEVTVTEILTSLPRFGSAVFTPEATTSGAPSPRPTTGLPVTNAPVPANYLVGPGDELTIRSWSGPVEHYSGQLIVDPEGKLYLPLLGEVAVANQTLAQLATELSQRFGKFYRGSQTTAAIVAPRSVEVYVTGDATAPGKYTLAGTATVFTALYAASGPSAIGSLRNVRLSRRGQPAKTLDLYDYLLTGSREQDEALLSGDTVFVGPSLATIGIAGLVRRPALYEMKDDLTVGAALQMAAGLDPRGYAPNVEIWRVDKNTAWNVINIDLNAPGDPKGPQFRLRDGDLVLVRPVLEKPANTVEVIGAVRRPGVYEVTQAKDVAGLIQRAEGLDDNAYVEQGAVWRLTPNHDYKMLRFNVRQALGKQQPDNLALKPGDKLYIHSRDEVTQPQDVAIAGAVSAPGVYPWAEDMRVSDLLLSARGTLPGAYTTRADLLRLTPERRRQLLPVSLGRILTGDPEADLVLQPGDQLTVYAQSEMAVASQVMISGGVQRPGLYERQDGMRISDLIYKAGGLLPGAAEDVEYTKGRTAGPPQVMHLRLLAAGTGFQVEPDVLLSDDDHVAIMGTGDFKIQPQTVVLQGMVTRPGTYALLSTPEKPDTLYALLQRGGLLLSNANPRGIVLYRLPTDDTAAGQTDDVNQVLKAFNRETAGTQPSLSADSKSSAMSGSIAKQFASMFSSNGEAVVVIPPRPLNYDTWANAVPIEGERLLATQGKEGDMPLAPGDTVVVPALPTTVAVIGAVVRPGAVRYQGPQTPQQYVNLAGGPAVDAKLDRLVVIRANGAVVRAAEARQVQAGDVVVVPSDFMVRQLGGPSGLQRVLETVAAMATAFILK